MASAVSSTYVVVQPSAIFESCLVPFLYLRGSKSNSLLIESFVDP
jgi:hypothetical protein